MVGCKGDERGSQSVREDFVRRVVAAVVKLTAWCEAGGTSHAAEPRVRRRVRVVWVCLKG